MSALPVLTGSKPPFSLSHGLSSINHSCQTQSVRGNPWGNQPTWVGQTGVIGKLMGQAGYWQERWNWSLGFATISFTTLMLQAWFLGPWNTTWGGAGPTHGLFLLFAHTASLKSAGKPAYRLLLSQTAPPLEGWVKPIYGNIENYCLSSFQATIMLSTHLKIVISGFVL